MAYTYEQLKHIKADHPMVVAFGSAGTQKARFCRWRYTKDGAVAAMVQKWVARRKAWLERPVPVSLNDILDA